MQRTNLSESKWRYDWLLMILVYYSTRTLQNVLHLFIFFLPRVFQTVDLFIFSFLSVEEKQPGRDCAAHRCMWPNFELLQPINGVHYLTPRMCMCAHVLLPVSERTWQQCRSYQNEIVLSASALAQQTAQCSLLKLGRAQRDAWIYLEHGYKRHRSFKAVFQ